MDENKILRKCVACGQIKSRDNLIKITINSSTKEIGVNPNSVFFGRSAYVCASESCVENAFKKGRLYKLLKIKPDETLKEKIRAVLDR